MQEEGSKVNPGEHRQDRESEVPEEDLHLSTSASVFGSHERDLYSPVLWHLTPTTGERRPGQVDRGDRPIKDSKLQ